MPDNHRLERIERKLDHLSLMVEALLAGNMEDTAELATLKERLRASSEALKTSVANETRPQP